MTISESSSFVNSLNLKLTLYLLPILKGLGSLGFSDITSLLRKADRNYNIIISKGRKLGGVMTKGMRSCC